MNKIFTKIVGAALGLAMAIGVGVAVASGGKNLEPVNAGSATYTEKAGTSLAAGDKVLIVASPSSGTTKYYVPVSTSYTNSAISNSSTVTSVNSIDDSHLWTVEKNSTSYAFKFTSGNSTYYLTVSGTGTGNKTRISTDTTYKNWNITSATNGYSMQNATTNNYFGVYTSGSDWRVYASATQNNFGGTGVGIRFYTKDSAKTVSSISVADNSGKSWYAGNTVAASDLTVTVNYSSGDPALITNGTGVYFNSTHTQTTSAALAQGSNTVTVYYQDSYGSASNTVTISAQAARTLSSIALSGTYPTTFDQNETFSHEGMVVTASYSSGDPSIVTGSALWSGYDMSTLGSQTVTVSYTESGVTKTTTYTITVNEKVIDQYELIKSTDDLSAGSSYLIGDVAGTAFMSTTQNGNNRGKQDPGTAASNDVVEYTEGFEVLTLGGEKDAWTFYANNPEESESGAKGYLYAASSGSNHLKTQTDNDANGEWSVAISDSGGATIIAQGTNTRNKIRYNYSNNPPIFSCYASDSSTGSEPALWKKVDTSENIALNKDSVSDMKGNTNCDAHITANNFTPTGISATYSVASIATVTAGTISDGIIPLNVSCLGVGSTVATITVNGGNNTHQIDLSITVTQKPASLTLVNENIKQGEIDVKLGGTRQISFTALDTDSENYSIDYSGITALSSDDSICGLSGSATMVLNGKAVGDVVVTCTITATVDWQSPITQTLTVHVMEDYNERNVSITEINNVNVEQGSTLVIADHISAATATTHFGTKNNPIKDNELLFSYTDDRSTGVTYSNFVWDVTNPELDEGDTETRTVYVFVTFDESYAGKSFTAIVTVKSRPVVGLKVDGVSKNNDDDINLELSRNSTYNFNEHVTVDPVNATQSHEVVYVVEEGDEYVSVSNGLMTIGSKIGDTVACVSATPAALDSFTVYFWISIAREAMTITADLPDEWNLVTDESELEAGDQIIITDADSSVGMVSYVSNENNVKVTAVTVSGTTLSNIGSAQPLTLSDAGSGKFYINDGTYYLYAASSGGNQLKGKNSQDSTNGAWKFEYSSDHMSIIASGSSNRNVMQYNKGNNPPIISCYATASQTNLQVYKLSGGAKEVTVTDELFNVVNGAMSLKAGSTTLYDLDLCDASGASFSTSAWNTLGNQFTSAIKSDNKLAYARADRNGNEIEQFLATYDYVVAKYGVSYDYLGRIASGKISASGLVNPLVNIIGENTNSVAIIVVVSVLAVTAIGGYFFIRKRKELN